MRSFVPVVLACAGLLTGCGSTAGPAGQTQDGTSFQNRAAEVAKAWQDAGMATAWARGFVPLQELTLEPAWSPNEDLKASFGNGWIRTTSPLPDSASRGDIRFADGTSMRVPLVGAQTASRRFPKRSGPCPSTGQPPTCQWLTITAARRSTVKISTTRGPAVVPAWSYTIAGLAQPLWSVAVAPSAITSLPMVALPDNRAPEGVVSAMDHFSSRGDGGGGVGGVGHVLAFTIGIGACDKDPRGLVRETPELVVVGGSVTPPDAGTPCNASLELKPVEVVTHEPVGTRPVVDALSGRLLFPSTLPAR